MAVTPSLTARRRRSGMALALAIGGLGGCGGARIETLETEVSRQREELSELRRNQAAQRVQFDEFRNRLVVLQDKLESERLAAQRAARAIEPLPQLPHVVVSRADGEVRVDGSDGVGVGQPAQGQPAAPRSVVIGSDGVARDIKPEAAEDAGGRAGASGNPAPRRHKVAAAGPSEAEASRPPQEGNTAEEAAAAAYRDAKAVLDGGRLDEARAGFERFLEQNPDHPLADNALYWIGETWYAKSLWLKAARVFGEVVTRFPRGNKVPDAMLKTALCYDRLGEAQLSREVLGQLSRLYPASPAGEQARDRLQRAEER